MDLSAYSFDELLLKRRSLRRELLSKEGLVDLRIAVLGGTTTTELTDLLELLLLDEGFKPEFYQSAYGRFYEEAVFEHEALREFRPDVVYVHTCSFNIQSFPAIDAGEETLAQYVTTEMGRFKSVGRSLRENLKCQVILNNFELPAHSVLGSLDAVSPGGATRFILELNREIAVFAAAEHGLVMQDLHSIAARIGMNQWCDPERWFSYKIANTVAGSFAIAGSLKALICSMYGRSRKALVLDLDNTLWGGEIGEDGVEQILIGKETPVAEAYTAFQRYCLKLRERGVLLAVCSKNDESVARLGLLHPDSVLKLEHFSAFRANWEPKHENILSIAQELNLSADSFVFIDDNPAERALVVSQIPGIAVPDIGSDVARYIFAIESQRYFEPIAIGNEDLLRADSYEENKQRAKQELSFANYEEYLDSLEMKAEIAPFNTVYLDRIAQLTNKTNQFNLTTKRFTAAELEATMSDGNHLGLYGKLQDRFGDNGLVSVVLGRLQGTELHLDLWLMSCRVLKREMEVAMLDVLVEHAKKRGVDRLIGYYIPTSRNKIVADHYQKLAFQLDSSNEETCICVWSLAIEGYRHRNQHIRLD